MTTPAGTPSGTSPATTHRERVIRALRHEETDRVPIDFGGGPATQIQTDAYRRLLAHLGMPSEPRVDGLTADEIVTPSELVLRRFDVDIRGVRTSAERQARGQDAYVDEWGVVWERVEPATPFINVNGPLQYLDTPVTADLDRITWPSLDHRHRLAGLRERTEAIRRDTDYAIILNLPNAAFSISQRVRGFAELLEDLLLNEAFATGLLERVTDFLCDLAAAALREVGDLVDCVSISDDLGTQEQPMVSPSLYRSMVKPHHARLVDTLRRNSNATVVLHSDGSIRDLLGDIIDCGVQAINPVQVSTAGMDPAELKREFGAHLSFWGGVDTHHVLPRGTPDDVSAEVRRRLSDLGRGGGYVLASVHNILAEVPPENIVAMFDTARAAGPGAAR
jgi:uroporphyrinogen decarboxylase